MAGPVPYDSGNAKHVQARVRLDALTTRGDDEAFRAVVATEDGRRVLYGIAMDCGWRDSVWDSTSARQTDFNAGLQEAGILLMRRFAHLAPAQWTLGDAETLKRAVEADEIRQAVLIPSFAEQQSEDDNG